MRYNTIRSLIRLCYIYIHMYLYPYSRIYGMYNNNDTIIHVYTVAHIRAYLSCPSRRSILISRSLS